MESEIRRSEMENRDHLFESLPSPATINLDSKTRTEHGKDSLGNEGCVKP